VVHATTVAEGSSQRVPHQGAVQCIEPICRWKKGAVGKQDFKRDSITVESIEEAAVQFGGRFCVNCEVLLKASLRLQVHQLFGS